jgi:hypothetical protein
LFQIPASVISSVGTINYPQHQLYVVSKSSAENDQAVSVAIATAAVTANAQNTFSVPSSVTDGNVNIRMIQQTTNVQPPRLHPKKRKFDLSELEDDHQSTATSVCNNQTTIPAPPTTSTGSTLSYHKSVETNHGLNGNGSHQVVTSGNYLPYNPTIMTQVVKNTGVVEQVIKKQIANYR